jgi:hypothetical protein
MQDARLGHTATYHLLTEHLINNFGEVSVKDIEMSILAMVRHASESNVIPIVARISSLVEEHIEPDYMQPHLTAAFKVVNKSPQPKAILYEVLLMIQDVLKGTRS